MSLIIGIVLTCINGWLLLDLIGFSVPAIEKLALGFVLSLGLHTVIFFMISLISYHPSAEIYWLSLICIFLIQLLLKRFIPTKTNHKNSVIVIKLSRPEIITLLSWCLIGILFLVSLSYTLIVPVHTTDSLHLYDFRAKVIYHSASLQEITKVVDSWFQYPMFTTLANLFVRYWGIDNPSFIYPVLYLCFALIFFYNLKRNTSTRVASVTTLLMFSTPLIYWQSRLDGLTNLPFAIFYCSSILYLLNSGGTSRIGAYLIATLLLSLSSWTRITEPFWMVPLAYMSFLVLKNRNLYLLLLNFYIFRRVRNLWDIYADNRKHISISTGLKALAGTNTADVANTSESASTVIVVVKEKSIFQTIIAYLETLNGLVSKMYFLFIAAGKFIFPIIVSSLTPVVHVFFVILALDLLFVRLNKIQLHLLVIIMAIFALLWAGATYSSIAFENWNELGNSLSRILGFFVPLMWFFVGISPTIKHWDQASGFIKLRL